MGAPHPGVSPHPPQRCPPLTFTLCFLVCCRNHPSCPTNGRSRGSAGDTAPTLTPAPTSGGVTVTPPSSPKPPQGDPPPPYFVNKPGDPPPFPSSFHAAQKGVKHPQKPTWVGAKRRCHQIYTPPAPPPSTYCRDPKCRRSPSGGLSAPFPPLSSPAVPPPAAAGPSGAARRGATLLFPLVSPKTAAAVSPSARWGSGGPKCCGGVSRGGGGP